MHTVVIGCSKGGVGKTTLAAALAVEAARLGNKVAIADFDPVQSLARWHDRRVRIGLKRDLTLIEANRNPAAVVREARLQGCDALILDSPPFDILRIRPLLEVSDFLVVPVRPSALDVEAIEVILELAGIVGIPHLIVMNAASLKSSVTRGARRYLMSREIPLWSGYVPAHRLHIEGMLSGLTAAELDPESRSAREVQRIWLRIKRQLRPKRKPRTTSRVVREVLS